MPKPVFIRLLMLFGGGAGCLLVGIIVTLATGDLVLLAMSVILGAAFITKGFLLKRKINAGQMHSVSGVCVNISPKIFGRYRRIELVDTVTGGDISFVLPKKVEFKVGHVYTCYFHNPIRNSPESTDIPQIGFLSTELDLPTNGFLGFEDSGIYQEKPALTTPSSATNEDTRNSENERTRN